MNKAKTDDKQYKGLLKIWMFCKIWSIGFNARLFYVEYLELDILIILWYFLYLFFPGTRM